MLPGCQATRDLAAWSEMPARCRARVHRRTIKAGEGLLRRGEGHACPSGRFHGALMTSEHQARGDRATEASLHASGEEEREEEPGQMTIAPRQHERPIATSSPPISFPTKVSAIVKDDESQSLCPKRRNPRLAKRTTHNAAFLKERMMRKSQGAGGNADSDGASMPRGMHLRKPRRQTPRASWPGCLPVPGARPSPEPFGRY